MPKQPDKEAIARATALLIAGEGVREVARKTGLSHGYVGNLKQKLDAESPNRHELISAQRKEAISELVEDVVRESLDGCRVIARKVKDEKWVNEQNAFTLSTLYRELGDKSLRILEAAERAQERQREAESRTIDVDPA